MKAIGYCPRCRKPFDWHKNELDFSRALGVRVLGDVCVFLDDSQPGYGWGLATRKPALEYLTGARMRDETCGFINPLFPNLPCREPRGHSEDLGTPHDAPLDSVPLAFLLKFVQSPARDPETGLEIELIRRKTREGVAAGLFDHEGNPARSTCANCGESVLVTDDRCGRCERGRDALRMPASAGRVL